MKIRDLSKVDLPREKLAKYGLEKLSDHELLAIILGSGIKDLNVIELSKKILKVIEKIGLEKVALRDLAGIKGLGIAKASQVLAAIELGRRFVESKNPEIFSNEDIWKLCSDIRDSKREHFAVFYIDTQSRLIERRIVSIGTLSASLVHPREVYEPAVSLSAASIIIAHNHPSGLLQPSAQDKAITIKLKNAGEILGIPLEKHIIITKNEYLGFI